MKKNLYIIAGCNGAGKTTASFAILPKILDCHEFVNADEIARGLSPFQPANLAKERVKKRVAEGGHNIDEIVIERRYLTGIVNLFDIYFPIVDVVFVFDNSEGKHELIAKKTPNSDLYVIDNDKFNKLKS